MSLESKVAPSLVEAKKNPKPKTDAVKTRGGRASSAAAGQPKAKAKSKGKAKAKAKAKARARA